MQRRLDNSAKHTASIENTASKESGTWALSGFAELPQNASSHVQQWCVAASPPSKMETSGQQIFLQHLLAMSCRELLHQKQLSNDAAVCAH